LSRLAQHECPCKNIERVVNVAAGIQHDMRMK